MGLDLTVRVQRNFTVDENGKNTWQTVELANLRGCWHTLEELSSLLENGFSNCATFSFYGKHFYEVLNNLKETKKESDNEILKEELTDEIRTLSEFLEENNVQNDDSESYEVHAWW